MMTPEQKATWLAERCGCHTASNQWKVESFLKDGKTPAKIRTDYAYEILSERLTSFSVPHVVTGPMEHGLEYEDEAADVFVGMTGRDLRLSRFYRHPTIEYCGATPDRELDTGEPFEIKCPATSTFLRWKLAGVMPEQHKPQMLLQMACMGKTWGAFMAYDPRIKDENMRTFFAKYEPPLERIRAAEEAARTFLAEVEAMWDALTTGQAA